MLLAWESMSSKSLAKAHPHHHQHGSEPVLVANAWLLQAGNLRHPWPPPHQTWICQRHRPSNQLTPVRLSAQDGHLLDTQTLLAWATMSSMSLCS